MRISFSFIGDSGLGFSTFWYLSMAIVLQGNKRWMEEDEEDEETLAGKSWKLETSSVWVVLS